MNIQLTELQAEAVRQALDQMVENNRADYDGDDPRVEALTREAEVVLDILNARIAALNGAP